MSLLYLRIDGTVERLRAVAAHAFEIDQGAREIDRAMNDGDLPPVGHPVEIENESAGCSSGAQTEPPWFIFAPDLERDGEDRAARTDEWARGSIPEITRTGDAHGVRIAELEETDRLPVRG